MNSMAIQQIAPGAVFVVDTLSYFSQITPLDLSLATQTISYIQADEGLSHGDVADADVNEGLQGELFN